MSRVPEYSISIKGLDGAWQKLGSGYAQGVVAENVTHSHELPGGPSTMSFTLKRDTRVAWPDLTPFTPIACSVGGVRCWSGRISQTPTNRGASSEIQVSAQGLWHHLSDDPIDKGWVYSDLSKGMDTTSLPGVTLPYYSLGVNFNNSRSITLAIGQGVVAKQNRALGAVTFDLGPNNVAKRIVFECENLAMNAATVTLIARSAATVDASGVAGGTYSDALSVTTPATAATTRAGTFSTGYRYVTIFMYFTGADTALGSETWWRINSCSIFTDTADESGNASILKASTVIGEALAAGADTDIIDTSTTGITTTSFSIPEYYTPGRRTVAQIIDDVNNYHAYQTLLTPDPLPRLIYRAVPTTPTYILNDADGYEFQNASANDASEIYNRVRMTYTQGDGTIGEVTSTASPDNTFPGKRGFTRTKIIEARSKLSSGAAQQIADTYLATYQTAPLKGSVTCKGYITRYTDGARIPVGALQAGDVILLGGETDPETGARGRTGQIAAVTYSHNDQTASITLDSRRDYLDALLARIPS